MDSLEEEKNCMKYQKDIALYLKSYPDLRKWINECVVCHIRGYKPEMPEHIGSKDSIAADNIRKYFKPLEVNDMGICLQCFKYFKISNNLTK